LSTETRSTGQWTGSSLETSPARPRQLPAPPCAGVGSLDFCAVYEEHFAFVWRTARRLGVPEGAADDVVQDVFLVVHRRLHDYDGVTPVKFWILGIVTRVVAGHRRTFARKHSRDVPHAVDRDGAETTASTSPAPVDQAEQAEALRLVVSLLDELDADKREVLVLAQFEEMSAAEIAECLGLNINTVSGRLRAARRAFDAAYARHRARTRWRTA